MQIFINELSLTGQYVDIVQFTEAILTFSGLFALINEKVQTKQMYKDSLFINREAIKNELFQASFQKIRNPQLKVAFKNSVFNKLNPKDWRTECYHDAAKDLFAWQDEDVSDTSLAELAERKIQNEQLLGLLINFSHSQFATHGSIIITKNEEITTALDCLDNKEALEQWLEVHLKLSITQYDILSKDPPTDKQTILRDSDRFQTTSKLVQGRKIHKEVTTGYYWYVDNFHNGAKSHLEVFDAQGQHLGEATLEGQIDATKIEHGRTIDLH